MAEIQPHVSAAASERRQGGLVEAYGGHGEAAVVDQVGQVGGDQLGRRRQGQRCQGIGPGLEGAPGGAVGGASVVGDAVGRGASEPPGGRRR